MSLQKLALWQRRGARRCEMRRCGSNRVPQRRFPQRVPAVRCHSALLSNAAQATNSSALIRRIPRPGRAYRPAGAPRRQVAVRRRNSLTRQLHEASSRRLGRAMLPANTRIIGIILQTNRQNSVRRFIFTAGSRAPERPLRIPLAHGDVDHTRHRARGIPVLRTAFAPRKKGGLCRSDPLLRPSFGPHGANRQPARFFRGEFRADRAADQRCSCTEPDQDGQDQNLQL